MEKHPFFMKKPIDEHATDLPPAVEALRQLKWDEDETPKGTKKISNLDTSFVLKIFSKLERALRYKDEGNLRFKSKHYKSACMSYREGLKLEFDDNDLKSVLHSNLAASN
jgi:hypothetical protein